MVLNYVWIGFVMVAFIAALIRAVAYFLSKYTELDVAWGSIQVFSDMVQSTFQMAETSVEIAIYLIGVMALWLGIMKIGENGGAVAILTKWFRPFFKHLFPEVPPNHPAIGSMVMNFSANMLGLDNAATPLGLKAMHELQNVNPNKDTASNAQIMFLVLNTSGLTIIPVSIMALRAAAGAANPADVFLPILLTTFFSTLAGLLAVSLYQRINLLHPTVLLYLGSVSAFIGLLISVLVKLPTPVVSSMASFGGNLILLLIIVAFVWLGVRRNINVYESFIEGAKEGFGVAIKIIPYLVAMLVSIGLLRASGVLDFVVDGIAVFFGLFNIDTSFTGALPTAIMKPLSGSGARGLMVEAMEYYGPDSFTGRLASTFQGSTETTFYTLAVYYGAVGISRTRYTLTCGLIADATAIVAGIFMAYIFFSPGN